MRILSLFFGKSFRWSSSLFAVMLLVSPVLLTGQSVIIDEEVTDEVFSTRKGPNGTHYFAMHYSFTSRISGNDELKIQPLRSIGFDIGMRYKLRFCNFYSNVFDLELSSLRYHFKNTGSVISYQLADWNREYFRGGALLGTWYQRFNFGKRGNHLGKFIDLGVFGQLNYSLTHRFLGEDGDVDVEARKSAFSYANRLEYGLAAGLGWNTIRLKGRYRMSDLIKPELNLPDLPRWLVGIEFSF